MSFWDNSVVRIISATLLSFFVGGIYYNPIFPWARKWLQLTYPTIIDPTLINSPMIPMSGTFVAYLLAAVVVNRYVNARQLPLRRLVAMAVELWILTVLITSSHLLFSNASLKKAAIEHVGDLFVLITMAVTLGYRRTPPMYPPIVRHVRAD